MSVFWLSFCEDKGGKGKFLGVCLVRAKDSEEAMREAWRQKCNPGGQVMIVPLPKDKPIPAERWFNRLLTREEAEQINTEMLALN